MGSLTGCSNSAPSNGGTSTPISVLPAISSITPTTLIAGSTALTLTVSGSGFSTASIVQVGTVVEPTTYGGATQLTATIPAAQLTNGAELPVIVFNRASSSSSVNLEVDNPVPAITSSSVTTALAGTASAVITFTGTGFVPSTVINVNGADALHIPQYNAKLKLFWWGWGKTDIARDNALACVARFRQAGVHLETEETADGHEWKNWRLYLSKVAPMLFH